MVHMMSNFTSSLKKVIVNHYARDQELFQLIKDDFGLLRKKVVEKKRKTPILTLEVKWWI